MPGLCGIGGQLHGFRDAGQALYQQSWIPIPWCLKANQAHILPELQNYSFTVLMGGEPEASEASQPQLPHTVLYTDRSQETVLTMFKYHQRQKHKTGFGIILASSKLAPVDCTYHLHVAAWW